MGACLSGGAPPHIIDQPNGNEEAYQKRYLEDHVLGEGEFGIVKLVHDVTQAAESAAAPLACKVLRKGIVFKDNVLYAPLKPEVLRGEVEMLRTLNGESFCLKLIGIYESARLIYMITEYCGGGEMMEYIASQTQDLRSEDVSRIAYQLLSAVDHCAKHGVLHRDIKPENIMFQDPTPKAELRLIDFGSGTMRPPKKTNDTDAGEAVMHTTFAGSAFYISPELFQRSYNQKTDVWSAGVTLYVLVAGYPADDLQKAFNILQTSHNRNLRSLPNMPHNMPDSYYELLEGCLTYRHKKRPSAGELLQHEFVKFHREIEEEDEEMPGLSLEEVSAAAAEAALESPLDASGSSRRTASVSLKGSVVRHNLFLGFKKFERSLTTILATMLSKTELQELVDILNDALSTKSREQHQSAVLDQDKKEDSVANSSALPNEQKLWVIPLSELKHILSTKLKNDQVLETIDRLPNSQMYNNFAYHVALLKDFSRGDNDTSSSGMNSFGRKRRLGRSNSFANGFKLGNGGILTASNSSLRSTTSLSSRNRSSSKKPSSVHGGTLFASLRPANMKRSNSLSA